MNENVAFNAQMALQMALFANLYRALALAHFPEHEQFMKDFERAMRETLTFRTSVTKQPPGSPDPSIVLREAARQAELHLSMWKEGVRKAVSERKPPAAG